MTLNRSCSGVLQWHTPLVTNSVFIQYEADSQFFSHAAWMKSPHLSLCSGTALPESPDVSHCNSALRLLMSGGGVEYKLFSELSLRGNMTT